MPALVLVAIWLLAGAVDARKTEDQIEIVYPREGQTLRTVDSAFIFGSVPQFGRKWQYHVTVNGHEASTHPSGGFLAYVPISAGEFEFLVEARLVEHNNLTYIEREWQKYFGDEETSEPPPEFIVDTLRVFVPEPLPSAPVDSLAIVGDYNRPFGHSSLSSGDMLEFGFIGTPGCRAWCSIEGVADSIPMAETKPRQQPYWGETTFGVGAVPDSLKLRGIYTGFVVLPDDSVVSKVRPRYHIVPPSEADIARLLFSDDSSLSAGNIASFLKLICFEETVYPAGFALTLNAPEFPFAVEFIDSVQVIRHAPQKGYYAIHQPMGVTALAVGEENDWYRLRLAPGHFAWARKRSVERLSAGITPYRSYLRSVLIGESERKITVEFPLAGQHPHRVIEDGNRTVRMQIFGVTTDTDWIRFDYNTDIIELATWHQPSEDVYEFRIDLTNPVWGYDHFYRGNTLVLELVLPPKNLSSLKGKTIVIDPGHSHDPGAIGPTGYTEAEANLGISLVLRQELQKRGARVVMTRDDDSHLSVYDRPAIAKEADADLFVSIHNNALPDGVNPFANNGTSSLYYHPHSIDLARAIHREMVERTGLPDHGLYHGNLAVNRATEYPAVLVECAFMMIPEQEAMLKTEKFRKTVAKAIRRGIERFLEERSHGQ